MTDHTGQMLGNYRLLHLIGRGGFADVYLAEHLYLNTKAAIKVLQTRLTNEDSTSFKQEARTIASLVHPHIVRVLDFGLQDEVPYLVMDYAPNGTLRQRYPKGLPVAAELLVPHVKQVASALMYAHERKLIHRDIKPENMLLNASDEVLLSDFGIAMVTQSSRSDGTKDVVGTAAYMAPEQIQGKPRPASDQYALGVVVYEWLTGDRPFSGTFTEVATQHMFAPPPPLRQKIPLITPDVEMVVMTALSKDPQQRFQSVQAFANAFEQASQSNLPTFVSPSSVSSPSLPTIRVMGQPTIPLAASASQVAAQGNAGQMSNPLITTPQPSFPVKQEQKGISRRTVVFGLAGASAVVLAGGGLAFWGMTHNGSTEVTHAVSSKTPVPPATRRPQTASTSSPTQAAKPTQAAQPTQPPPTQQPTQAPPPTSPPSTMGNQLFIYRPGAGIAYGDVWSPDGSRVASCYGNDMVQSWNATNGGNMLPYQGSTNSLYALAWSNDGQLIAAGGEDTVVQVWQAASGGSILPYTGHSQPVYAVAFSPDSSRVVSGGGDLTVQVWNATSGTNSLTYTNHTGAIRGVAWSPDGRYIASASEDATVQVWDANTGQRIVTYTNHTGKVLNVAWSPDSAYVVSCGWDATCRVWQALTGNTRNVYYGHSARVWGVDWSPSGNRIASAGHDTKVKVWDAFSGSNSYTYSGHSDVVWTAQWSPNAQLIASASTDGTVQVWQAT